jgi:hypothetical protein
VTDIQINRQRYINGVDAIKKHPDRAKTGKSLPKRPE